MPPAMRESGGLLLQVVSNAAFVGSVGQSNYAASKAGVMGLLYSWDVELQRFGIRTNALWPIAQTDMTQVVFETRPSGLNKPASRHPSPTRSVSARLNPSLPSSSTCAATGRHICEAS